jgi:hypothetical protein
MLHVDCRAEYLHLVLTANRGVRLPAPTLWLLRHAKFRTLAAGDYSQLTDAFDRSMTPWLAEFQVRSPHSRLGVLAGHALGHGCPGACAVHLVRACCDDKLLHPSVVIISVAWRITKKPLWRRTSRRSSGSSCRAGCTAPSCMRTTPRCWPSTCQRAHCVGRELATLAETPGMDCGRRGRCWRGLSARH